MLVGTSGKLSPMWMDQAFVAPPGLTASLNVASQWGTGLAPDTVTR